MRLFFLLILLGIGSQAKAKTIEIERPDGSILQFYLELPERKSFPFVFLIHGSTCTSAFPMFQASAPILVNGGFGVISLEKYGITQSTSECPKEYLENNNIQNRIIDHLLVVAFIRKNFSHWSGKFVWAGGSEGGQIAALTSPLVSEAAMIVMLASGGGLTMGEELPIVFERSLRRQGASEDQIEQKEKEIANEYNLIRSNPTHLKEWLSDGKTARNTYKYWDSILWIKALPLLEKMEVPMLLVHGTEDTSCPIESSELIAARFGTLSKTNLTFKVYPGLEHNWSDLAGNSHAKEVLDYTFAWIFQNLTN